MCKNQPKILTLLPNLKFMKKKLRFNSKTIHGGQEIDSAFNAIMPPIYQTSTYVQDSLGNTKALNTVGLTIQLGKH